MPKTDLEPTLTSGTPEDVTGSTNDYCLGRDGQTNVAGDAVVIANFDQGPAVLLIKRGIPPFTGIWALPGGMHDVGEAMTRTVERELMEEVGVDAESASLTIDLGTIESTSWDPRFVRAEVSATAFLVELDVPFAPSDDADDAAWVPISDLVAGTHVLAFEHAQWLARAFAARSPLQDLEIAEAFEYLAVAARVRNRELINQINDIRAEKGATLIPLDSEHAEIDQIKLERASKRQMRVSPAGPSRLGSVRSLV